MSDLLTAARKALEVLLEHQPNPCLIPETQEETDRAEAFSDAITALRQAIEHVEQQEGTVMADYEFKTYKTGGAELEAGFYSTDELRDLVKLLDKMNAVTERSIRKMK